VRWGPGCKDCCSISTYGSLFFTIRMRERPRDIELLRSLMVGIVKMIGKPITTKSKVQSSMIGQSSRISSRNDEKSPPKMVQWKDRPLDRDMDPLTILFQDANKDGYGVVWVRIIYRFPVGLGKKRSKALSEFS